MGVMGVLYHVHTTHIKVCCPVCLVYISISLILYILFARFFYDISFFCILLLNRLSTPHPAYSFLNTISYHFTDDVTPSGAICLDHDHELLKPQLISTWMPNGVGSMPGKRVIFAETQVSIFCYCVEIFVLLWLGLIVVVYRNTTDISYK